jgi:radical SAM protein with 4Fe4S-binding SPASM domain
VKPLSAPVKVSIDVTDRCNFNCSHCRNQLTNKATRRLDFVDLAAIIDDAALMRVFRLGLSGGEPFLRDDLEELIRRAIESGIPRVFVSTNGSQITEQRLQNLVRFRDRLTFKISLDGPADVHDTVRGAPSAFQAATQAITLLKAKGFDVQITTTLMKSNVGYLRETLQLVRNIGCSKHYVVETAPLGRADETIILTPAERQTASEILAALASSLEPGAYKLIAKIGFVDGTSGFSCCAGVSECGILSDGRVVGCRLLPEIHEGYVQDRPLSELWRSPRAFAYFRDDLSARLGGPCKKCPELAACRGGCRVFAAWRFAEEEGPDIRCPRLTGSARATANVCQGRS